MYHPEGFQAVEKERMVCRLVKSLDGFRQRPRVWYIKIAKNLQDNAFRRSFFYSSFFIKSNDVDVVILMIYVDDIIITVSEVKTITKVKSDLSCTFDMENLGPLHYCLSLAE